MRPILLLAPLLLAGCLGAPAASVEPAADEPPATAPSPVAEPTSAPTPEPAPEPKETVANGSEVSRPAQPRLVVLEADYEIAASVGHPCQDALYPPCGRGPSEGTIFGVAEGGPATARLTMWWNATAPAATVRWVQVSSSEGALAAAEGESPLVLELPVERLAAPVEIWARATAAPGGAAVAETVHYVLELEYR